MLISRLICDSSIEEKDLTVAKKASKNLNIELEFLSKEELVSEFKQLNEVKKFENAKKTLFFTENKGTFLKKCPGSRGVVCCNYFTINSVTGCPFDCSYCILQHYINNNPFISVFLNRKKVIGEMEEFLKTNSYLRVGTGELADSLAIDDVIEESSFFMKALSENSWGKKVTFEFKTKSDNVDLLLENKKRYPNVDVVVGFSVNVERFIEKEEKSVASLEKRLIAAKKLQKAGIPVAIHFDPIIMLDEFFEDYKNLVQNIFSTLDQSLIRWISMGGFRHSTSMNSVVKERFPFSKLLVGEMFPSDSDGKLRYLSTIRRKFYNLVRGEILKIFPKAPLYMCMEKNFVWEDLKMDIKTLKKDELKNIFD